VFRYWLKLSRTYTTWGKTWGNVIHIFDNSVPTERDNCLRVGRSLILSLLIKWRQDRPCAHHDVMCKGGEFTAPLTPNLYTRCRWVINFSPRPFLPLGKNRSTIIWNYSIIFSNLLKETKAIGRTFCVQAALRSRILLSGKLEHVCSWRQKLVLKVQSLHNFSASPWNGTPSFYSLF